MPDPSDWTYDSKHDQWVCGDLRISSSVIDTLPPVARLRERLDLLKHKVGVLDDAAERGWGINCVVVEPSRNPAAAQNGWVDVVTATGRTLIGLYRRDAEAAGLVVSGPQQRDEHEWEEVEVEFEAGRSFTIRQRWIGCDPPGPIGSGVQFLATRFEWHLADDGVWERWIYEWRPAAADDPTLDPQRSR